MNKYAKVLMTVMVLLCLTRVDAQQQSNQSISSMLSIGSKIRLQTTATVDKLEGVVVAVDDSLLTLAAEEHAPIKIAMKSITQIEVVTGRRSCVVAGICWGAGIGFVTGLVAPVNPDPTFYDLVANDGTNFKSRGEAVGTCTVGGGIVGALVGLLIKKDEWTTVYTLQNSTGSPTQTGK
jgi:hypothetical protein